MDGYPRTKFDYEWWELQMVEDFLELPYASFWNSIDEKRELEQFDLFSHLPFFDVNDVEMLDIPVEDWSDEDGMSKDLRSK